MLPEPSTIGFATVVSTFDVFEVGAYTALRTKLVRSTFGLDGVTSKVNDPTVVKLSFNARSLSASTTASEMSEAFAKDTTTASESALSGRVEDDRARIRTA